MSRINPYLRFNDGKCREAMNFYKKIFGGELEFNTIGESPMAKEVSADKQDLIMHSTLTGKDFKLFGSDMMRDKAVIGDNVTVAFECASEKEINKHFSMLAEGGDIFMEPEESYWGGIFAMVTDKYGVEWSLNFQKIPVM